MRLCRLHFKNLNSLAGEWNVNFEDPAFSRGFFSITGPTGAGKSTLLDAMCLALFGRTPRLDRVNNSGNEIMTRGTSECFAEATFEIGGKRYSALWSQKRATRKNSTGALQAPKCRLSRLVPDADILAENVSSMSRALEEICRLDFERFTRTVVLPQGGFAAFLQADGADRARMLEELTGADIYRKISKEVFERNKREKSKLEGIEASRAEHTPLSDEAREAAQRRSEFSEAREKELRARGETLQRDLGWYARFDDWTQRRDQHQRRAALLERDLKDFEPQSERLAQAERAALIRDFYDGVRQRRDRAAKLEKNLKSLETASAADVSRLKDAEESAREASEKLLSLKDEAEAQQKLLQQVRDLDRRISEHAQKKKGQAGEAEKLQSQFDKNQKALRSLSAELARLDADVLRLNAERDAASEARDRSAEALYRADLSALSAALEEGSPCPLCGSLHHPSPCAAALGGDVLKLRAAADKADKKLKDLVKKLGEAESKLSGSRQEQAKQEAIAQSVQEQLDKAAGELAAGAEELSQLQRERAELFGVQDVLEAERDMKKRLSAAEKAQAAAEKANADARVAAAQRSAERKAAETSLAELQLESFGDESELIQRFQRQGFTGETPWLEALMDEDEMESLRARRKELLEREETLKHQGPVLEAEGQKLGPAPAEPREKTASDAAECSAALSQLLMDRGADEQLLRHDEECRRRLAELEVQREAQRKVCALWGRLNDQIGSAKGDAFSKYVQGLTFRRLVSAANVQLVSLSDRYRLAVSKEDALRLDVADLWQGGEIRTSRNLSGGESFIVSLALALALSHGMREVRVDSLFLDEGFGALDDESLDTVLECLNRLHDKGKLIGVISHVKALRDRVECQIEVTPSRKGHSTLSGPGCCSVIEPC